MAALRRAAALVARINRIATTSTPLLRRRASAAVSAQQRRGVATCMGTMQSPTVHQQHTHTGTGGGSHRRASTCSGSGCPAGGSSAAAAAAAATAAPVCAISVFEMFSIGIGPSSSHTVGPMRAAERFCSEVAADSALFDRITRVACKLYGSLALTGIGHGTPGAVMHGLEGGLPHTVNIERYEERVAAILKGDTLKLAGVRDVEFDRDCLPLLRDRVLPKHSNGMEFFAYAADGSVLMRRVYYSIGGGFFVSEDGINSDNALAEVAGDAEAPTPSNSAAAPHAPFAFASGADLLRMCKEEGLTIPQLAMRNEMAWRR